MMERPKYRLTFRPTYPGADDAAVISAIRWLLKRAGRTFKLQCIEITIEKVENEQDD